VYSNRRSVGKASLRFVGECALIAPPPPTVTRPEPRTLGRWISLTRKVLSRSYEPGPTTSGAEQLEIRLTDELNVRNAGHLARLLAANRGIVVLGQDEEVIGCAALDLLDSYAQVVENVILRHSWVVFADHDIELASCLRFVACNNKTLVSHTARIWRFVLTWTRRERISFVETLDLHSELPALGLVLLLAGHLFQRKRLELSHVDVVGWAGRCIVDMKKFASLRSFERC